MCTVHYKSSNVLKTVAVCASAHVEVCTVDREQLLAVCAIACSIGRWGSEGGAVHCGAEQ